VVQAVQKARITVRLLGESEIVAHISSTDTVVLTRLRNLLFMLLVASRLVMVDGALLLTLTVERSRTYSHASARGQSGVGGVRSHVKTSAFSMKARKGVAGKSDIPRIDEA